MFWTTATFATRPTSRCCSLPDGGRRLDLLTLRAIAMNDAGGEQLPAAIMSSVRRVDAILALTRNYYPAQVKSSGALDDWAAVGPVAALDLHRSPRRDLLAGPSTRPVQSRGLGAVTMRARDHVRLGRGRRNGRDPSRTPQAGERRGHAMDARERHRAKTRSRASTGRSSLR